MATLQQLESALIAADRAGAADDARVLAGEIKRMRREQSVAGQLAKDREAYDPTKGMSTTDKVVTGIGAGLTSAGRAVGQALGWSADTLTALPRALAERVTGVQQPTPTQALGLPTAQDTQEAQRLNAPLLATTPGMVGNVVGLAAPAALAIPFTPATIGGAAAAGAGTGALLTEGDLGDRAIGAGAGALGGTVGAALPYALRIGSGALRGLAEPLTVAGRDRIAGRVIQRFATRPDQIAAAAAAPPSVTGAQLTLPEVTRDTGLAALQRLMGAMDTGAADQYGARLAANNAARLEALRAVAGGATRPVSTVRRLQQIAAGQPTREAAEATRGAAAARSYGEAFEAGVDQQAAEALAPQIASLMERPSIRAGLARARVLAAEEGIELGDAGSVQGLHYLKTALDDMVGRLREQPARQRLVQQTSRDLADVLEEISPLYQAARREFQANSVPVNRAAVGERLVEGASGALRNFQGDRTLQARAFARALNDEAELLRQAGSKGGAQQLEDLMTATQMQRINAVRDELETLANLSTAANGPGSQTLKMSVGRNLVENIAGPMGLPDSFMDSVIAESLQRPVQWLARPAQQRIEAQISAALMDPSQAARLLALARAADARAPASQLQLLARRYGPAALANASAQGTAQ
jgi:hypothetical protein